MQRSYFIVVLDARGEPMSTVAVPNVDHLIRSVDTTSPAWNPQLKHWTFSIDGYDLTSRTAIDIARKRRQAVLDASPAVIEHDRLMIIQRNIFFTCGLVIGFYLARIGQDVQTLLAACALCLMLGMVLPIYRVQTKKSTAPNSDTCPHSEPWDDCPICRH